MKRYWFVPAMASAFAMLGACSGGGGGVGSTPPPPSTPTPTPTPTPAANNTSLIAPLVSESFTNDAATGTASYPVAGTAGSSNAALSSLAIAYDASTNSYAISTGGRSQTFRPSDRDAMLSSAQSSVFVRTSGSTTDTLTMTIPSAAGGPLAYRYVGAGFWQRTNQGSGTISGSSDAFTYGVETPDSAVPRTGAGAYAVSLLGTIAKQSQLYATSGSGTLQVDFVNNLIQIQGIARETDPVTGFTFDPNQAFSGSIPLSSSSNGFSGAFRYYSSTSNPDPYDGSISGRFYGPAAEEVGGAFFGRNAGGSSIVGTITGTKSTNGTNITLTNLVFDQSFTTWSHGLSYVPQNDGGATGTTFYGMPFDGGNRLSYASGSFSYQPSPPRTTPSFAPADRVAAESNARFTVYRKTTGADGYTLTLYNPGSGNPDLGLSYASFGIWEHSNSTPYLQVEEQIFVYGLPTGMAAIPKTGTATYNGVVYGKGFGGANNFYTVGGTSRFLVDFAGSRWNAQLMLTGTDRRSGAAVDFGTVDVIGNNGLGDLIGHDSAFNTTMIGFLAGPNAEELVAHFLVNRSDPLAPGTGVAISGATVAKR